MYFELKKAILESGLKQGFIARKAGIEQTIFSKKINGHTPMTKAEKSRVAQVLRLPIKQLFFEQKESVLRN